jgi:hypothetical protein
VIPLPRANLARAKENCGVDIEADVIGYEIQDGTWSAS